MKTLKCSLLLETLLSVQSGLTNSNETLQQSSCFVFRAGNVHTFDEETLCTAPIDLGFEGAVPAEPLLAIIQKMPDEEVVIRADKNRMLIKGRNKTCGIRFDRKIVLPIENVKIPKKWTDIPKGVMDAVAMVTDFCSTNDLHFGVSCVHMTPSMVEATDNVQACRVTVKTGLAKEAMIRSHCASALSAANVTKFAEADNWLHFKGGNRVISVRRFVDHYPNLSAIMADKGSTVQIPKGLHEAADKAAIFAGEDKSATGRELIAVELEKGRITVSGEGAQGWYRERRKAKYSGPTIKFAISPATLIRVAREHTKATVNSSRLSVEGKSWRMIFCLFKADNAKKAQKKKV